ncbi:MAG: acyltransferase [Acidisphaera sp.]|nr:acyltransferase [Acidisphaera sp.]
MNRFRELDAFRGLAALWVVLFHYGYRYDEVAHRALPLLPPLPAFSNGNLPVFWFFIISGFVITWTIERSAGVAEFAVSRFTRLYPTYWAALLLTFAVGVTAPLPIQHYTAAQLLWNLTMVQEYAGVEHVDGAYWSLSVELLFYAYMAAFLAMGWTSRLAHVALAWAALSLLAQLAATFGLPAPWRVQLVLLLRFVHFFAAGIAFFHLWRGREVALSALTLLLCAGSIMLAYEAADAVACLVFLALFLLAISGRLVFLVCRVTVWLGAISYALYVSHELLGFRAIAALDAAGVPHALGVAAAIAGALTLATLLTAFVERPASRSLRRALGARRAEAPAVAH